MCLFLLLPQGMHTSIFRHLLTFPHGHVEPESNSQTAIITYGSIVTSDIRYTRRIYQSPSAVHLIANRNYCEHRLSISGIECEFISRTAQHERDLQINYQTEDIAEDIAVDMDEDMAEGQAEFQVKYSVEYQVVYQVLVFHLEVLMIRVNQAQTWLCHGITSPRHIDRWIPIDKHKRSARLSKVKREAIKAIYVLGLDYGMVTCSINSSGKFVVFEVQPTPPWKEPWTHLLANAMNQLAVQLRQEDSPPLPIGLGADPEFLLRHRNGKIVPASRFFLPEGVVGCDGVGSARYRHIKPLAELRPRPSLAAEQLTSHVFQTMQYAACRIADDHLEWLSGGMPYRGFPLGGHLHFSNLWLNSHLLRALDNYLALPLMMIEGESARYRRPRYGTLGDFRHKSHGGFEYRTLPSWLISPTLTRAVFALSLCIAYHYRQLQQRPLDSCNNYQAFYQANRTRLRPYALAMCQEISQLTHYPDYEQELSPLFELIETNHQWNEQADIRHSWNVRAKSTTSAQHQ
jgi:hypothetical protein